MDNGMNWVSLLHAPDDIVEIRSIDPKPVISGYFRADSPNIEAELSHYPNRTFYQTMNCVKSACYSRSQHERLISNPRETTTDNDILGYQWILIDADPVRPSGVSSTRDEKQAAHDVAAAVMRKLKELGFNQPIVADSGNGYHLLYKIRAGIEQKQDISDFLMVLDMWFSTETVKIDTAVYNPARITKLYGTIAHKGADTPDRPHRQSRIITAPQVIEKTTFDLVQNVASEYRKMVSAQENPRQSNGAPFEIERFLADHQMEVTHRISISNGTKFQLARCPFDESHRNGDAAVFAYSNGSFGFHCFHNSCSGYHWHEFREKLDPQAYANSPYTIRQAVPLKVPASVTPQPDAFTAPIGKPRMIRFGDIPDLDRSKIVVIRSRFASLDAKIGGFNKGEMSVWSGGNASGKSTLVSQLALSAVSDGFKVAIFSGEMPAGRVREWMLLQAAGPEYVEPDKLNPNHFCVKPGVEEKIKQALADPIAIYDNDFGTKWEDVVNTLYDWVREEKADVVVIDNLMALDIPLTSADKYDMQSQIVKRFSLMAKQLNIHVHFICHPRKTEAFLRKNDISGTADITNTADNVFMIHRVNADFMCRYKMVYPKLEIPADAGNVIEIMKNRDMGVQDEMIMLYFDRTCKLMSDVRGLPPQHSWTEQIEQLTMEGFIPVSNEELPPEWRNA